MSLRGSSLIPSNPLLDLSMKHPLGRLFSRTLPVATFRPARPEPPGFRPQQPVARGPMTNTRWGLRVLFSILLATAAAAAAEPEGQPHVYKQVGATKLKLYVTKPPQWKADQARPAIVFFHGGGWTGGAPGQFSQHSQYLASRGMVAVQVQYRLLKGKKSPPDDCIRDAKSAMRWVRSHAQTLGIDPNRIASAGGSAGGHLAAFVGMADGLDDPQDDLSVSARSNAMVLFNPVYDNGPTGWGHARVGDQFRKYSPFHQASREDPPSIVFLGTQDALIPVATAQAFQAQLKQLGVRSELVLFAGKAHGFFNYGRGGGVDYYETVLATDRFLASLGWLAGEPTIARPDPSR